MAAEHWLLAALIGAVTAVLAGVPLEYYKRHRDRRSVAAILGAEITGLRHAVERNDTIANFEKVLAALRTTDVQLPKLFTMEPTYGPLFEKNIDRIGLLPVDIAEKVVLFYGHIVGMRAALHNLIKGDWEKVIDPKVGKASQIEIGLKLWRDADAIAETLVPELRMIAAQTWWTKTLRRLRGQLSA